MEIRFEEPGRKVGGTLVKRVKRGGRVLGELVSVLPLVKGDKPEVTFWANRHEDADFLRGQVWTVEPSLVNEVRRRCAANYGIVLPDGTRYLTPMSTFKLTGIDGMAYMDMRLGIRQWIAPLTLWEVEVPPEAVRVVAALKKARVPGRGRRKQLTIEEVEQHLSGIPT